MDVATVFDFLPGQTKFSLFDNVTTREKSRFRWERIEIVSHENSEMNTYT